MSLDLTTVQTPYQVHTWTLTTTRGRFAVEDGMTFVYQMSDWTDAYLLSILAAASRSHTCKPIDIEGAYYITRNLWKGGEPCSFEYDNCTFTKS